MKGLSTAQVALPFSNVTGKKAWGNPARINRLTLFSSIRRKLSKNSAFSKLIFLGKPTCAFEIVIKQVQPKVIIAIGAPAALCKASRKNSIPIIELSHAIGLTSLNEWGWNTANKLELPTGVLSLDPISTETFLTHSADRGNAYEVKEILHPFLKRFLFPEFNELLPVEWQKVSDISSISQKRQVLVTLVWGYAQDHNSLHYSDLDGVLPNGLFPESLEKIIKDTEKTVFWRFRLHPVQLQNKKYAHLVKFFDEFCSIHPNTEWVESSKLPLPVILQYCRANVSMLSMSSYEAAYFGIPSLLLCPSLGVGGKRQAMFSDLVDLGYVVKGNMDYQTIYNWVTNVDRVAPLKMSKNEKSNCDDVIAWMLGSD